jgi:mRNA interferase RelE/StbE
MTCGVDYSDEALEAAGRLMKTDVDGLRTLFDAIDTLATDPRPDTAFPYGSPNVLRLRMGLYRALYQIYEDTLLILIIHIGRAEQPR